MKKVIKIILVLLGLLIFSTSIYLGLRTRYQEDIDRRYVHADDGRIMIMHGMNIFSDGKSHPSRVGNQSKKHIMRLTKDWGYNSVRLLIFWDGIEPEKGKYDYEYLQRVKDRLDWCEEAGLKVILDMHQDLYAVGYGGDGAPDWAIFDDGEPFELQVPWELNYFQPAVKAAISNFWDIERGHGFLQEHFINSVVEAVKYLGDHPSIVGIDLYNEPTSVTLDGYKNLEKKYMTPFYQKLIDEIRTVDNDIWIFYEPSAMGVNQGLKSDLGLVKDSREGEPRLVYFPHIYTIDLDVSGEYIGNPFFINLWANARQNEYQWRNEPMMIGEFGLGGNDPNALAYATSVVEMCDEITGGWFYWDYTPGDWSIIDSDNNEVEKAKVLDRPYPRLIAGVKPSYHLDLETSIFTFKVNWNKEIAEKLSNHWTEIYIPRHLWTNGWELNNIKGEIEWNYDEEKRLLNIKALKEGDIHIEIVDKTSK